MPREADTAVTAYEARLLTMLERHASRYKPGDDREASRLLAVIIGDVRAGFLRGR